MGGYEMEHRVLNLNELPTECGDCYYVVLEKDDKPICRLQCHCPPAEFHNLLKRVCVWNIYEIKLAAKYPLSELPGLIVRPAYRNSHERKELVKFLDFLQTNKRVALVTLPVLDLYILPPSGSDYGHIEVLYHLKSSFFELANQVHSYQGHELTHFIGEGFSECSDFNIRCVDSERNSNLSIEHKSPQGSGECTNLQSPQGSGEFTNLQSPQGSGECINFQSISTESASIKRNLVQVHPLYLGTLGHIFSEWIFGAVAELVDNARDAKATRLNISVEALYLKKHGKMIPVLSFVDDGHGMSHVDIVRMLSLGHKRDYDDPDRIGRYGVGFKNGSMKLGKDAIVLTQTVDSRSVGFLSQSFNEGKDNLEIPIVSYSKKGNFMEIDTSIHSEAEARNFLDAIKEFSPFNEYVIGQKLGLFDDSSTGTQIYIWNLAMWSNEYALKWSDGDILIRSERTRSRPGQLNQKVPLDYSLQAYLEVIFLEPRMKIFVQGSLVKTRPLAKYLSKTAVVTGDIMRVPVQLTLGLSQIDWEMRNCGIFLYWHGRLIEAYKRVGGMAYSADIGRGVIGVIDVTNVMIDMNGEPLVHSNKQGFQDSEAYAKLVEWLGNKSDEYWDDNFDVLKMAESNARYKADHEWVQCDKCRKWRVLSAGFDTECLPASWFCYMPPFNGQCETPEQTVGGGVITLTSKRSNKGPHEEAALKNGESIKCVRVEASQVRKDVEVRRSTLKRLRRGPSSAWGHTR